MERTEAREYFINGGNGFEDGEDGARAVSFTFAGMVECAAAYATKRVREELEAVCRLLCPYCQADFPVTRDGIMFLHIEKSADPLMSDLCRAQAVQQYRAELDAEAVSKGEV